MIDVANLFKMESLTVSGFSLVETPEVTAAKLLGPHLRSLALDYNSEAQDSEPWDAFGHEEARWIEQFAKLASVQRSSLRKIMILFEPYEGCLEDYDVSKILQYPWVWMEDARDVIRPLGINLSWSRPCVSKEEFERIVSSTAERLGLESDEHLLGPDELLEYSDEAEQNGRFR